MNQKFKLTDEQLKVVVDICKKTGYLVVDIIVTNLFGR